jgi:hypothetical protein
MPIVGDSAYLGLDLGCGLLLAAEGITFTHPTTNQSVNFSLGEPSRFSKFWDAEKRAFEALDRDDTNRSFVDGNVGLNLRQRVRGKTDLPSRESEDGESEGEVTQMYGISAEGGG